MRMRLLKTLVALALSAAPVTAQEVTWDYDKGTDFSKRFRYTWADGLVIPDQLNHRRIVAVVDSQLSTRGLSPATVGAPDLLVTYHVVFHQELEVSARGRGVYRAGGSAQVSEVAVGTLVLELRDPATREVVWRASATREVDPSASPRDRDRNIAKAVGKMLKHYPPTGD